MHHHHEPSFLPPNIKIIEDHRKRPSTSVEGGDKVGHQRSCSLLRVEDYMQFLENATDNNHKLIQGRQRTRISHTYHTREATGHEWPDQ
ncbi:unnamed protein product [Musa hybrid cultivar]